MINKFSYKQLLFIGILSETIIFSIFYFSKQELGDVFRYSARYSGRLSLIIYIYCFYKFYMAFLNIGNLKRVKDLVFVFGFLHVIHFGFLALSVYLNNLTIIPVKITGGALAYIMIIIYPFIIEKIKKHIYHLVYFYYVGFVMLMTYVARIKGDFEGAEPKIFHKIAFVFLILVFLKFGYTFYIQRKNFKHE